MALSRARSVVIASGVAYRKLRVQGRVAAFRKMGWLRPPRFMPTAEDPPLEGGNLVVL